MNVKGAELHKAKFYDFTMPATVNSKYVTLLQVLTRDHDVIVSKYRL